MSKMETPLKMEEAFQAYLAFERGTGETYTDAQIEEIKRHWFTGYSDCYLRLKHTRPRNEEHTEAAITAIGDEIAAELGTEVLKYLR